MPTPDAENNYEPEDMNSNDNMILCNATNKYDITINNNNNNKNIEIQVPDSRCEKSKSLLWELKKLLHSHSCNFIGNQFRFFFYANEEK